MGEKVLKREIKKRKIEQRLVNFLDDDKNSWAKKLLYYGLYCRCFKSENEVKEKRALSDLLRVE